MSIRCGPYRIVALHCGKFDYAELEIDTPVHLIGPNNVGKTSLIALLQFLYLDDQRQMQFARDMNETRRYYFPEKYSYALFECLTPTGFQVVGVRGLGPVRQHNFERFVYTGRIDLADYVDDQQRVREPEDTFARLAVKGFKKLEPKHLRAAITGMGDGREVVLGLVPARHSSTYERFRKVFGNILRLSHIRQDELKQLLLDIYHHDFQQREIDLARHYAAGFEQVKRDSHDVQELKLLQTDIERLLRHLERRDQARTVIPALWQAIGRVYTDQRAALDRQESALLDACQAIEQEQTELRTQINAAHAERLDLAGRSALLQDKLSSMEAQRQRFEGFVPDWARQRQATVRARQEELIVKLKNAADEPVDEVRARLRATEQQLVATQAQFENLAHAAVNHLRKLLSDEEISDAFSVMNPEILKLPVNTNKPGLQLSGEDAAAKVIRELLQHRDGKTLKVRGMEIDLKALQPPDLATYHNPEQIQRDISGLEREVQRYAIILEAAEQAESLRAEKTALDDEWAKLVQDLDAYDAFCAALEQETAWKNEQTELQAREQALTSQITAHEERRNELTEASQGNRAERDEIERQRNTLQTQSRALPPPTETWPFVPLEDCPTDWDELGTRYRKAHAEEQQQAEQVSELLDAIERRTYGRYVRSNEADTIQALRDEIASIPQRETAVEEMWKGIAVGIKKDLQNIGRDLETLKGLVSNVNRRLASVKISNLASLRLLIKEEPQWVKLIREITVDDELPLFSNPAAADEALAGIGRLLSDHPKVELQKLFNLSFEVGTLDGKTYRHAHLDTIESNGTTMAIKVLVNLVLLRGLLGGAEVQIPFYLDECSSLDEGNLKAIVHAARQMGFIAVLASPDAMDAADKLYFIEEQADGRVVLDPRTAMVRIQREPETVEEPPDA